MIESQPFKAAWERSTTRKVLRWMFSWRVLRCVLFIFVGLVTAYALFYTIENWRGKRAWRAYEKDLKAQGVVLDLKALLPPEIPEASNFAATPYFADLFKGEKPNATNSAWRWPALFDNASREAHKANPELRKYTEARLTDLVAWEIGLRKVGGRPVDDLTNHLQSVDPAIRAEAAREILAVLKIYDPVLDELRAASHRPASRYLVHYDLENPWGILLPHLAVVKSVSQLLNLKVSAELAATNTAAAFDDLRLMLRLVESLTPEPFLISELVNIAFLQFVMSTLWEGMTLQRWSERQLAEIQTRLAKLNFVETMQNSFAIERTTGNVFVEQVKMQRDKMRFLEALDPSSAIPPLGWLIPSGWFDFERLNHVKLFQTCFMPASNSTNRTVDATFSKRRHREIEALYGGSAKAIFHHYFLARAFLPGLAEIHKKTARGQTAANQTVIACALERYRLTKGQYPADLNALIPEFLREIPLDPVNGGPMKYRAEKPIRIYSIGWDEKDDGGTPGGMFYASEGDWVWTVSN